METVDVSAFINRKNELKFLKKWLVGSPKQILFIHGPKSSGKTKLIYKLANEFLNQKRFDLKIVNLMQYVSQWFFSLPRFAW